MLANKKLVVVVLALATASAIAQTTGKTVRHHTVATENQPIYLSEAEAAIDKKDYATAEALLNKVVASDPANYAAWFDLGFVHNAVGKSDQSIASYRRS